MHGPLGLARFHTLATVSVSVQPVVAVNDEIVLPNYSEECSK